ncbi:hypothetical protein PanWU01x14_062190, partial [Parasponia andersonii]
IFLPLLHTSEFLSLSYALHSLSPSIFYVYSSFAASSWVLSAAPSWVLSTATAHPCVFSATAATLFFFYASAAPLWLLSSTGLCIHCQLNLGLGIEIIHKLEENK